MLQGFLQSLQFNDSRCASLLGVMRLRRSFFTGSLLQGSKGKCSALHSLQNTWHNTLANVSAVIFLISVTCKGRGSLHLQHFFSVVDKSRSVMGGGERSVSPLVMLHFFRLVIRIHRHPDRPSRQDRRRD